MIKEHKIIIDSIINKVIHSFDLLKSQGPQEEIIFLPIGILLLKWISDSKERLLWRTTFNYNKLINNSNFYNKDFINNLYLEAKNIEDSNPELAGIFTELCFSSLSYIEVGYVKEIISAYANCNFHDLSSEKNITGPFIELFLQYLSNNLNSYSFITTLPIRKLMSRLFNISENMSIADITCGTGGILSEVINQCNDSNLNNTKIKFYGQEINFKIILICKINLLLHGIRYPEININDSLKEPIAFSTNKKVDVILSNLPLGLSWDEKQISYKNDFKYGIPNKNNAEWIFIQRGLEALGYCGKAAFIVSKGTLTRKTERKIREQILNDDIIEAVISLPNNLYGTKTIPIEVLIINKDKPIKNKILFIDASKEFTKKERGRNDLSEEHIEKIINAYCNFVEKKGYSKIVELSTIANNKFELDSSFYINYTIKNLENLKMRRLSEVADIKRGLQISRDRLTDDLNISSYYYIKISDLINDAIEFNDKIDQLTEKEISLYELKPKDLIISARGSLIKTAIYEEGMPPCVFSGNILLIRLKSNYNPYFLKFYLNSKKGKELLSYIQEGATIIALNPNKLKEMLIPDINIDEQNQLAERITLNEKNIKKESD
ncbi:N-6 DNA methylase [Clostridium sp. Marseille-Q7071]